MQPEAPSSADHTRDTLFDRPHQNIASPHISPAKTQTELAAQHVPAAASQSSPSSSDAGRAGLSELALQLIGQSKEKPVNTQPAPRPASSPAIVLQGLPPLSPLPDGELNRDHLKWYRRAWYSKIYVVAVLPKERLGDFVKGEGRKGLTNYVKSRNEPSAKEKVHLLSNRLYTK